jgi:hypothetical protein
VADAAREADAVREEAGVRDGPEDRASGGTAGRKVAARKVAARKVAVRPVRREREASAVPPGRPERGGSTVPVRRAETGRAVGNAGRRSGPTGGMTAGVRRPDGAKLLISRRRSWRGRRASRPPFRRLRCRRPLLLRGPA